MKPFARLRGRIVEKFGSQKRFAEAIEKTEQKVIAKLSGRSSFGANDILHWSKVLEIQSEEIGRYFFEDEL